MTFSEIETKYGNIDKFLDTADIEEIREYKKDCFDAYEQGGFCDTFITPYKDKTFDGQRFEVIGRVQELSAENPDGADLECLPMWIIRTQDGHTMAAYPEEICKIERKES